MNLVFMNSLEMKVDEHDTRTAQVLIQESEGIWQVQWHELNEQGHPEQEQWFEGRSWDEMLNVFRYRLAEKLATGFTPLLDSLFDADEKRGRSKHSQVLDYYSEQHVQEDIFQLLRKWRTEQATKEGKAPYLIATNRMFRIISTFLPHNREELLQIPGMGEVKIEKYGEDILSITKPIQRAHSFPLDWVREQIDEQQFLQWTYKQKEDKYKQEVDKQEARKIILQGISDGNNLEALCKLLNMSRRDLVFWIEQLEREGYDVMPLVDVELQAMAEQDQQQVMAAFVDIGDRYLKPIVQKIYSEQQLESMDMEQTYEQIRLLRLRYRITSQGKHNKAS